MNKIYQIVTERILNKLKEGVVPWRKPWDAHPAVNWVSQKAYQGVNTLLLEPGEYATFNQVSKAGGKVMKGSKSHLVVFWKMLEIENEEGEEETIPYLRYYNVFEINTQCQGLVSKRPKRQDHHPITEAEKIVKEYEDPPTLQHAPGRAFYRPSEDMVSLPEPSDFHSTFNYYSTLFHELIHSTGHSKRLNREAVARDQICFGDHLYSKEELVAEIGAAMLCGVCGMDNTIDNSAAYINTWAEKLSEDPKLIVHAASKAQKAADYIQCPVSIFVGH